MLSCCKDNTPATLRAQICAAIRALAAQGATLAELVDGLAWASALAMPEHAAVLTELITELRAGRIVEAQAMGPYGVVATKRTGRTVTILGTDWPIYHTLERYKWGWLVSENVCGGDTTLVSGRKYKAEDRAREQFDALAGEVQP